MQTRIIDTWSTCLINTELPEIQNGGHYKRVNKKGHKNQEANTEVAKAFLTTREWAFASFIILDDADISTMV